MSWDSYQAQRATILRNIHEGLVARDPVTNELIPDLASSWRQVDETTWEFDLRDNVFFHDGSQLDAEGAAFVLNYIWGENFNIAGELATPVSFEAVDRLTLRAITEEADPVVVARLWMSTIPSAEQLRNDPDSYLDTPIGTGPYQFESWTPGSQVVLTANPNWWGFETAEGSEVRLFERAVFTMRPEPSGRLAALQAGEVDFAESLAPGSCGLALGENCIDAPKSDIAFLKPDTNHPVLGDARIRRAISLSIDRQTVADAILGRSRPASQLVTDAVFGFNPNLPPLGLDLDEAIRLVEEARADGVPVDDFPILLTVRQGAFVGNVDLQQVVLDGMRRIGLTNTTTAVQDAGIFNAAFCTNISEVPEDRGLITLHQHNNRVFDFSASGFYLLSDGVCSSWASAEWDQLYDQVLGESDTAARESLFHEMMRLVYDVDAIIPIADIPFFHGISSDLEWSPRTDGVIMLKDFALRG